MNGLSRKGHSHVLSKTALRWCGSCARRRKELARTHDEASQFLIQVVCPHSHCPVYAMSPGQLQQGISVGDRALKVLPSGRNEIGRTGGRQLVVVNDGGRGLQRQLAVVIDGGRGLQSTG